MDEACNTITSSEMTMNWRRKLYHLFRKDKEAKYEYRRKENTEEWDFSITKETMMIEPEKTGFVVGRNGCNLKHLRHDDSCLLEKTTISF